MFRYIGKALDDPLFLRVSMGLWSLQMFFVAGFFAYDWDCGFEISWFLLVPTAALLMGLWLVYSSVFVDDGCSADLRALKARTSAKWRVLTAPAAPSGRNHPLAGSKLYFSLLTHGGRQRSRRVPPQDVRRFARSDQFGLEENRGTYRSPGFGHVVDVCWATNEAD